MVSRERAARMYTPLPYYLSTFLVTLPLVWHCSSTQIDPMLTPD